MLPVPRLDGQGVRWPNRKTTRKLTHDFRYEFEEVAVAAIDAARDHICGEGA
jgi:hypothetical protein